VPKLKLEIVTAERQIFSGEVNAVVAPGSEGQLGILPHHAPLMTILQAGELIIRKDDQDLYLVVTGGFLEVRPDKVVILADACERCDEIDIARAEEAKKRAAEHLKSLTPEIDHARAEAALRRSLIRLKVAERVGLKTKTRMKM
jgi:F-type H+-transporting ATPase subunit epsilon